MSWIKKNSSPPSSPRRLNSDRIYCYGICYHSRKLNCCDFPATHGMEGHLGGACYRCWDDKLSPPTLEEQLIEEKKKNQMLTYDLQNSISLAKKQKEDADYTISFLYSYFEKQKKATAKCSMFAQDIKNLKVKFEKDVAKLIADNELELTYLKKMWPITSSTYFNLR